MHQRMLPAAIVASSLLAGAALADDGPARHTVTVAFEVQPEFILQTGGEPIRADVDRVVAAMPPAIAASVADWTGISDRGKTVTVKLDHNLKNARFTAMSSGDGYDRSGLLQVAGKTLAEHDTRVTYREVLAEGDAKTFSVLGLIEFENRVTERRCIVVCRIEGVKPAPEDPQDRVIHPEGTATWIGPIVFAKDLP